MFVPDRGSDLQVCAIKQVLFTPHSGLRQTCGAHFHLCQTTLDYHVLEIGSLYPDDGGIHA
jgi:hypothetical protein